MQKQWSGWESIIMQENYFQNKTPTNKIWLYFNWSIADTNLIKDLGDILDNKLLQGAYQTYNN